MKVRSLVRRTFLTGEGELRKAGAGTLLAGLLLAIVLLELADSAPLVLYLAFIGVLGYAASERRRGAPAQEVEPVAPPYIPGDGE